MSHPLDGTIPAVKCANCPHHVPLGDVTACRFCDCQEHAPKAQSPYGGHNADEPPGAEAALEYFKAEMDVARRELEQASNGEVEAELARDAARRKWEFDDECPPVGVFGGIRTTARRQAAWIDNHIADEEREYRLAKSRREAASKRLDVLGRQAITQASIAKSVGTGYNLTRSGEYR
jgi:hypothetical protein